MQERELAQLLSPRRSRRGGAQASTESLPQPRAFEEPAAAQTGYDSDDEGEPGTTEVEELEDAPAPLPAPRARVPAFAQGVPPPGDSTDVDAPGPRLLDGYDTDPGGADPDRRNRRRALRRSISRRTSALLNDHRQPHAVALRQDFKPLLLLSCCIRGSSKHLPDHVSHSLYASRSLQVLRDFSCIKGSAPVHRWPLGAQGGLEPPGEPVQGPGRHAGRRGARPALWRPLGLRRL